MIVRETSRDAASAMLTVTANGRNSSPTSPLTNPMGRNTAMVVSVAEVMATATSRTPVSTAVCLSSP